MKLSNKDHFEALTSVSYDGTYLNISVISNGCTSSSDFDVKHEVINNQCNLRVVRTKPDMCKRAPMVAELSLEWSIPEECIGMELFVANPVLVTNTKGSIIKRSK